MLNDKQKSDMEKVYKAITNAKPVCDFCDEIATGGYSTQDGIFLFITYSCKKHNKLAASHTKTIEKARKEGNDG